MNPQFLRLPEPGGPERDLLRSAGEFPTLSPQLRERVLAVCHRQLVVGRLIRGGQRALLAALLLAGVVAGWRYWQSSPSPSAALPAPAQSPAPTGYTPGFSPGGRSSDLQSPMPQPTPFSEIPDETRLRP
ncbi:MAG: hypothetical protein RL215_123 [Planctomycetota bacterium]|jgi:hypothetical protein